MPAPRNPAAIPAPAATSAAAWAVAAALVAAAPTVVAAQEAAASPAPAPAPAATTGLADDEEPAREAVAEAPAGEEEPVVRTPTPLTPVDAWRENPTVVLSAVDVDLADFLWVARPVVVFADTEADPAFQQQVKYLAARMDALVGRDVVVLTDTDPAAMSDIRRKLRPRGFMLAILGKDGGVKLRKPFPWDVREITHAIDKFPLRKQELRDAREPNL